MASKLFKSAQKKVDSSAKENIKSKSDNFTVKFVCKNSFVFLDCNFCGRDFSKKKVGKSYCIVLKLKHYAPRHPLPLY